MHVAPDGLKTVRQDGHHASGSRCSARWPTSLPRCPGPARPGRRSSDRAIAPHWGFVIDGELTFVSGRRRQAIPSGRAFHVPGRRPEAPVRDIRTARARRLPAGRTGARRQRRTTHRAGLRGRRRRRGRPTVVPAVSPTLVGPGEIKVETWPMSSYVMTRVRMGERSGYTSGWCDAPHWGLVTRGRMAIEWEDDVEILSKGDIFHCPAGPPGHRLEAADPATFLDLTPDRRVRGRGRLADWRRGTLPGDRDANPRDRGGRAGLRPARLDQPAGTPSPASGSERSYPSRSSSSGVSIAAGSWATGVSRAWSRASTISAEAAIGTASNAPMQPADRRRRRAG